MTIDRLIERYIVIEPSPNEENPKAQRVRLRIDHQSFTFMHGVDERFTEEEATWFARQLAIALARFIRNEK